MELLFFVCFAFFFFLYFVLINKYRKWVCWMTHEAQALKFIGIVTKHFGDKQCMQVCVHMQNI